MTSCEIKEDELLVELHVERFDYSVVPLFTKTANQRIAEDFNSLVVDLSRVKHIDSTAISALLKLQDALPRDRLPIILRGVRPELICIIELMRLHRVFALEPLNHPV